MANSRPSSPYTQAVNTTTVPPSTTRPRFPPGAFPPPIDFANNSSDFPYSPTTPGYQFPGGFSSNHAPPSSAPPTPNPSRDTPQPLSPLPIRASTIGTPDELDRKLPVASDLAYHPASLFGHGSNSQPPSTPSPLGFPTGSSSFGPESAANRPADDISRLLPHSDAPHTISPSGSIDDHALRSPSLSSHSSSAAAPTAICAACRLPVTAQFVRALGTVYHLDCFRCKDCNTVVASKFFPIEGQDGRQYPLCERDYFGRLNLICAKCGMALRGSYITACNNKYHVEHFTCSVCPTLFGPHDSYYEHETDVYCHFHYSTRFATKCVGCSSAILKQFVEINRNMRDECWHPECYMIHKFWNVKVVSRPVSITSLPEPAYILEEQNETPHSLKEKQQKMEQQVYRIWTHLSSFEESSAACISDMLRHVSAGQYVDAICMAEKFILHVEVLFAAIDDLESYFSKLNVKGMSHVREARMLCRKTVDLFTLLSHTGSNDPSPSNNQRRMGMTQELLSLVTGLAHYLKILIRIALTGALKLEREYFNGEALNSFLDQLQALAVEGGNPSARRAVTNGGSSRSGEGSGGQKVAYGYKSLSPELAGESPFSPSSGTNGHPPSLSPMSPPPSDLCISCKLTVEEDCVRLGTYQRWHSHCVKCVTCGRAAAAPSSPRAAPAAVSGGEGGEERGAGRPPAIAKRPPAQVQDFFFEANHSSAADPLVIYCIAHRREGCVSGFTAVSRLEQYAFLLNVALRRLYNLLKSKGVMHNSPGPTANAVNGAYRDATSDVLRMKSVHLDRKLSATARMPKRSTIIESPTGKIAQPTDVQHSKKDGQASQSLQGHLGPSSSRSPKSSSGLPSPTPSRQNSAPADYNVQSPTTPSAMTSVQPLFARNNTGVRIIDETQSVVSDITIVPGKRSPDWSADKQGSPIEDSGHSRLHREPEESLTLGDIPQLLESEQAREQRRSLPRQGTKPLVAELTPLELLIVKHFAALLLYRSPMREAFDMEEITDMLEMKKNTFWNKLFKGNDKKGVKKKGVFGVPLELLVEREGADSLLGASRASLRIPSFIDDVISSMKQMDMSVEGIFRKNGNIRRLNQLAETLDRDPSSVDLSQDNPVQLAALLKRFLRELPEPLLTYKLHKLFIASQNFQTPAERKRHLHLVSLILPKCHRDTMEVLFVFLKWVASFSHIDEETGSKMDLGNLATVICPSILYSKGRDAMRDESFMAIQVVTQLLEAQDEFYTVPDDFLPILSDQDYFTNCMDLPSKDILKKCDTWVRLKQPGRFPQPSGMPTPGITMVPLHPPHPPQRSDSGDVRLVHTQKSDPALTRGRAPPPSANGSESRFPPRGRPASHSRERPGVPHSTTEPYLNREPNNPSSPPHPGLAPSVYAHSQTSHGGHVPPSPRPPPTPSFQDGQNWESPPSRPLSFVRPNGENADTQNGRRP